MNTNNEPISPRRAASKPIYGITPFTLLDFPHRSSCIFWFAGCNMRCGYCYNPEIVFGKGKHTFGDALEFLKTRVGLLEGIVLSGGECLLHRGIVDFSTSVKALGFAVKVDTNGSRPDVVRELISKNLIDYVALDFKAMPDRFDAITGSSLFERFETTFALLRDSGIGFEIRTTVHSALLDRLAIQNMLTYLYECGYKGNYYIQPFRNGVDTIADLPYSYPDSSIAGLRAPGIEVVLRQ